MIVAIHQPNFLPWLGFFHKMEVADAFVLLDDVPFVKGGYTNRVKIKTATGPRWLTVPVLTKGKLGQRIDYVVVDSHTNWRVKALKTLETNYRGCPGYDMYIGMIRRAIVSSSSLYDMNLRLIVAIAEELGINCAIYPSSLLGVHSDKTDRLIDICKRLKADTYLSGPGGADYQEEEAFEVAGIKLRYDDFQHPVYPQKFGEFEAGLSAIDLLFNCGKESGDIFR